MIDKLNGVADRRDLQTYMYKQCSATKKDKQNGRSIDLLWDDVNSMLSIHEVSLDSPVLIESRSMLSLH